MKINFSFIIFFKLLENILCNEKIKLAFEFVKNKSPKDQFKFWHTLHEKPYDLNSQIAQEKYKAFKINLQYVNEINGKNLPYKLSISGPFSDLTDEDFKSNYMGLDVEKIINEQLFYRRLSNIFEYFDKEVDKIESKENFIDSKDWSYLFDKVRNQQSCNLGGWALCSVDLIESMYSKLNGKLYPKLSAQEYLDCDFNNIECYGGWYVNAFKYVINSGINLEDDYLFEGFRSKCRKVSVICGQPALRTKIKGYKECNNCTPIQIDNLLSTGPYGAAIYADEKFRFYSSGIYEANCLERANHNVIVVEKNSEFIRFRNVYGESWGEKGYGKYKYNPNNNNSCYLTTWGVQPEV